MTHEELLAIIEKSRVDGITSLYLSYSGITDAGVTALAGAIHLKELWAVGNQITDAGTVALKRVLPNCRIYIGKPVTKHSIQVIAMSTDYNCGLKAGDITRFNDVKWYDKSINLPEDTLFKVISVRSDPNKLFDLLRVTPCK
jgi:hypothetical protein